MEITKQDTVFNNELKGAVVTMKGSSYDGEIKFSGENYLLVKEVSPKQITVVNAAGYTHRISMEETEKDEDGEEIKITVVLTKEQIDNVK